MAASTPGAMPGTALRQALARRFARIVVFSGAGMSADSGIPTFRSGDNGLWQAFDPAQLATPAAWAADPALVWGWYEWRRARAAVAVSNPGHLAVARLQRALGATVVTQNVDDLHERAGVEGVLHPHGSLFAPRCSRCALPHAPPPPAQETARRRLQPPRCHHCGGDVRPGVVWFGEPLDHAVLAEAARRIAACDLLLVVGTSGVVQPAAGLVDLAPADAVVVEINPQPRQPGHRPFHPVATTAAEGLPLLAALLQPAAPEDRPPGA